MSLRQITTIATAQPGTSNLPYPAYNLPPFVPVTTTIIDTDSAAIAAKTAALTAELTLMSSDLFYIRSNLSNYLEQQKSINKAISDIDVAIQGLMAATSYRTVIVAAEASNQIQTNNFDNAVANTSSLEMPSVPTQFREEIVGAGIIRSAANTQGTVTNFATEQAGRTVSWIAGTETYKDTSGWFKRQVDTLKNFLFPPSPKSTEQSTKAIAGIKSPE
jgi:hypothetical protein